MRLGFRHLLKTGAVTAFLAAGCNSVLGIEEAHLVDGGSAGTTSGGGGNPGSGDTGRQVPPLSTCDGPKGNCGTCLQTNCSAQRTNALLDNDARKAINEYRKCLGVGCADPQDTCLEALTGSAASQFAGCVQTNCATDCAGSPLVATVDLYCACMENHCGDEVVTHLSPSCPAAVTGTVSLEDLGCRLLHCEFAIPNFEGHCAHAVGDGFCPLPEPEFTCTHLNQSGYPCKANSECCSGLCGGGDICG